MNLFEASNVLNAEILVGGNDLAQEVTGAFGSNSMSEVLSFVTKQDLLITGTVNLQAVRTAYLMDMKVVCFVQDKRPDDAALGSAADLGITIMCSPLQMPDACGALRIAGLQVMQNEPI